MLYSTAVYFKAKEDIYFRTYEVEALHGLLFKVLSKMNPSLATHVHESLNKQFTLSNFMPFTIRRESAKVLEKDKEFKFRITFLDDAVYEAFITYFVKSSETLDLNGVKIQPTKILTNDPGDHSCGETTFQNLLEGKILSQVKLRFLTVTSFRRGERNYILPTPEMVFGSLLNRWKVAGGPALQFVEEALMSDIEVSRYELKTRREQFSAYSIKGFTGECDYWFGNLSQETRRELVALARFAFYAGIGYKTPMGLGQVRCIEME